MNFDMSEWNLYNISDEEHLENCAGTLKVEGELFQIMADQAKSPLEKAEFIVKSEQKYIDHEKFIIKYIL